jgi:hypothetical protein
MDRFFDMIDLGENIKRAMRAIRDVTDIAALVTIGPTALLAILFTALAWHFDIQSTWRWSDVAVQQLRPTFVGQFAEYLPVLVFTLSMLPTLVELFTVRFARADIALAQWLVYFFVAFDLVTDWPTASDFIDGYVASGVFDRLGLLATPAIWAAKIVWLLVASFGFEMLCIVFGLATLGLLLNLNRGPRRATV